MASIEFKNVIKRYGAGPKANQVIHGVNADIADGEFIVIVGPSGCGKSTLLRMVAGLEEISEGTISIGGRVVNQLEPAQRDIAMVFQNYALYPHMSVFENMAYGLKIAKVPKEEIRARVDKAAAILELGHLLERTPRQLSGGQRQRVAIVRSLMMEPDVLLLDEVTAALDPEMVREVLDVVLDLAREGMTMVIVTHEMDFARAIADRVVFMDGGRVVEVAPPRRFFARPGTERARRFLDIFTFEGANL